MTPKIMVGTSGYSYREWCGPFYPPHFPPQRMLDFYARHFPIVEINSTFYRIPPPGQMESLLTRSKGQVEFIIKAPQEFTHTRDRASSALPFFRQTLRPMADAHRLSGILLQFPYSFKALPENREHLCRVATALSPHSIIAEFRHASWIREEIFALLSKEGINFCNVDEPALPHLLPPLAWATGSLGYIRFHGRNAEAWWESHDPVERYNYLYSDTELQEWIPRARVLARQTEKCLIFFNNHAAGQAVQNARMFTALLQTSPLLKCEETASRLREES